MLTKGLKDIVRHTNEIKM